MGTEKWRAVYFLRLNTTNNPYRICKFLLYSTKIMQIHLREMRAVQRVYCKSVVLLVYKCDDTPLKILIKKEKTVTPKSQLPTSIILQCIVLKALD